MKRYIPLVLFLSLLSCGPDLTDPQVLVDLANQAHGTSVLKTQKVTFDFRDKQYSLDRTANEVIYTRSFKDSTGLIEDVLVNSSTLTRSRDGQPVELDKEWHDKYANSVNSVLYFFQLPLPLDDPAVFKYYGGEFTIEGEPYRAVKITFAEEDGGKDFEDQFYYWFHQETGIIDYMAYNYITDGGGVRFRKAINRRRIDGLVVQDYINYKPDSKQTPLEELPALLENGALKELSRIENTEVRLY